MLEISASSCCVVISQLRRSIVIVELLFNWPLSVSQHVLKTKIQHNFFNKSSGIGNPTTAPSTPSYLHNPRAPTPHLHVKTKTSNKLVIDFFCTDMNELNNSTLFTLGISTPNRLPSNSKLSKTISLCHTNAYPSTHFNCVRLGRSKRFNSLGKSATSYGERASRVVFHSVERRIAECDGF